MSRIGGGMSHRGFTSQELRDIFNLDPDRPEDRSAIAALQVSSTRHLDAPRAAPAQRDVRDVVRPLRRHSETLPEQCSDPCA
jgi:hypothetical protein